MACQTGQEFIHLLSEWAEGADACMHTHMLVWMFMGCVKGERCVRASECILGHMFQPLFMPAQGHHSGNGFPVHGVAQNPLCLAHSFLLQAVTPVADLEEVEEEEHEGEGADDEKGSSSKATPRHAPPKELSLSPALQLLAALRCVNIRRGAQEDWVNKRSGDHSH
eukprot:1136626-Pelagomonas_calceolata.AAC.4